MDRTEILFTLNYLIIFAITIKLVC